MVAPQFSYYVAMLRILRYLKGFLFPSAIFSAFTPPSIHHWPNRLIIMQTGQDTPQTVVRPSSFIFFLVTLSSLGTNCCCSFQYWVRISSTCWHHSWTLLAALASTWFRSLLLYCSSDLLWKLKWHPNCLYDVFHELSNILKSIATLFIITYFRVPYSYDLCPPKIS